MLCYKSQLGSVQWHLFLCLLSDHTLGQVWQVLCHWASFSMQALKSGKNTWGFHSFILIMAPALSNSPWWLGAESRVIASLQKTKKPKKKKMNQSLISIFSHLMGSLYKILIMLMEKFYNPSAPNVNDAPLSFSPQPKTSLSGSDHKRSQRRPWSGTSVGLIIRRICSIDWRSGDKPIQRERKTPKAQTA